jgi:hypothetical protein
LFIVSSSSDSSQFDLDAQPAMDSDATAATYAAATTSVHHAQISNFDISSPFYRGGMRSGVRSTIEAEQMLHKVPPSYRSGTTPAEASLKSVYFQQHGILQTLTFNDYDYTLC